MNRTPRPSPNAITTPTTESRSRMRSPSAPMKRAVTIEPESNPSTGERPSRMNPAEPVKPTSARAWTANDMLRATTKRLTNPATTATRMPASRAFWTNS